MKDLQIMTFKQFDLDFKETKNHDKTSISWLKILMQHELIKSKVQNLKFDDWPRIDAFDLIYEKYKFGS